MTSTILPGSSRSTPPVASPACTGHAQTWLGSIVGEADTPTVLASLAARVAIYDDASAVVVGTRGPVALHASRLKGDVDEIAIVIERPRPIQLAPRIMGAYDLTPRESQVTELVLRGGTTAQIARAMNVSSYTVQAHLKSIFAKVGVQTRARSPTRSTFASISRRSRLASHPVRTATSSAFAGRPR